MATPLGASAAPLPGVRRDLLEPSLTTVSLKYHTVPLERLVERTVRDLTHAGLTAAALGRLESSSAGAGRTAAPRLVLTGCIALSDHARAQLPPALGGANEILHSLSCLMSRATGTLKSSLKMS